MRKALDFLEKLIDGMQIALIALVVLTVCWQVLARYVTSVSTAWAPELAQMCFVWLAMLTIPLGVRHRSHMLLDVWGAAGETRLGQVLDVLAVVAVVVISGVISWFGLGVLEVTFKRTLPGLGIKAGWMYLAVPVGFVLCALFAVEAWWRGRLGSVVGADAAPPLPSEG